MVKKATEKLRDTGERMIPEFHKGRLIYAEHLTRYLAATDIVKDKVVLDIASGSGYGTKTLADTAKNVYGVDVDKDAVAYAQEHFGGSNITYKVGDGEAIPLDDDSVDVVITFETIEHIKDYKKFIKEVKRVLKADGLAIVSTPNDLEFAEGNHFHLHEFTYKELKNLLQKEFKNINSYFQSTWKYVAIGSEGLTRTEARNSIETLNLAPLNIDQSLYFYLVCSNAKIDQEVTPIAAIGEHYSDRVVLADAQTQQEKDDAFKKLTEHAEALKSHNDLLVGQTLEARNDLAKILNSRTYKLALSLANVKRKVKK